AYVAGSSFQASAADYAPSAGGFVHKINPAGTALLYTFALNGAGIRKIAVDAAGNAYLTGEIAPARLPVTPGAFQLQPGGGSGFYGPVSDPSCPTPVPCYLSYPYWDAFFVKLNPAGQTLLYSTYFGSGASSDSGAGIAVDPAGNVYLTGVGGRNATSGAFKNSNESGFVARFDMAANERTGNITSVSAANYDRTALAKEAIVSGFGPGP